MFIAWGSVFYSVTILASALQEVGRPIRQLRITANEAVDVKGAPRIPPLRVSIKKYRSLEAELFSTAVACEHRIDSTSVEVCEHVGILKLSVG